MAKSSGKRMRRAVAGVAVALGVAAVSTIPARGQINAEQAVRIGANVMSMKDYMLAISYFNQAIKAKPYLADPWFMRALAKVNLDDFQGALSDCDSTEARKKYYPDLYRLRGFCHLNLGNDSLALADIDLSLAEAPKDIDTRFWRAVALSRLKRWEEADSAYADVLRRDPKYSSVYTQRAYMNYQRGDSLAVLADLDSVLTTTTDNVDLYLLRAQINYTRGDWRALDADLTEAIRLQPDNPDLYLNRATARYKIDDGRGTLADLSTVLELDPTNADALYNRALIRVMVHDFPGAIQDFSAILSRDPGDFHALYNRALLNLNLRKWQAAMNDLQLITRKYPRYYPAYYAIAQCYNNMGNADMAIRTALYAEDIIRQYVKNPRANPLDRPVIDANRVNTRGQKADKEAEEVADVDIMDRYNQLRAVDTSTELSLSYDESIQGRVQDRELGVEPEELFTLSYFDNRNTLRPMSMSIAEVDEINQTLAEDRRMFVANNLDAPLDTERIDRLNAIVAELTPKIASAHKPLDILERGVAFAALKDYDRALADLDAVVEARPDLTSPLLSRAHILIRRASTQTDHESVKLATGMAARDLDKALELNPRLAFAWFNRGLIRYRGGDYEGAIRDYSNALRIAPEFAEALYNRGLAHIALKQKEEAISDLGEAGQLGMVPAYRIIKTLQR